MNERSPVPNHETRQGSTGEGATLLITVLNRTFAEILGMWWRSRKLPKGVPRRKEPVPVIPVTEGAVSTVSSIALTGL